MIQLVKYMCTRYSTRFATYYWNGDRCGCHYLEKPIATLFSFKACFVGAQDQKVSLPSTY